MFPFLVNIRNTSPLNQFSSNRTEGDLIVNEVIKRRRMSCRFGRGGRIVFSSRHERDGFIDDDSDDDDDEDSDSDDSDEEEEDEIDGGDSNHAEKDHDKDGGGSARNRKQFKYAHPLLFGFENPS